MRHGVVIGAAANTVASITTPCVDSTLCAKINNTMTSSPHAVDTNIVCLLGRLSMIGVGSPDTFIYPRRNRLEMPGTEPEFCSIRSVETTPITLSVLSSLESPLIPSKLRAMFSRQMLISRLRPGHTCCQICLLWCF